jgi:hypothetical protein
MNEDHGQRAAKAQKLLDCAKVGAWALVKKRLVEDPPLVNEQPAGRYSALHQAVRWGDEDVVRHLLSIRGCNVLVETKDGETPLDLARKKDGAKSKMVGLLLTAEGGSGFTPSFAPSNEVARALCGALHPRLGAKSPLWVLPFYLHARPVCASARHVQNSNRGFKVPRSAIKPVTG